MSNRIDRVEESQKPDVYGTCLASVIYKTIKAVFKGEYKLTDERCEQYTPAEFDKNLRSVLCHIIFYVLNTSYINFSTMFSTFSIFSFRLGLSRRSRSMEDSTKKEPKEVNPAAEAAVARAPRVSFRILCTTKLLWSSSRYDFLHLFTSFLIIFQFLLQI